MRTTKAGAREEMRIKKIEKKAHKDLE